MNNMDGMAAFMTEKGIAFRRDAPLRDFCTFRIGGAAGLLATPADEGQIGAVMAEARRLQIPTMLLGRGSNVLFADTGFDGLVIHLGREFSQLWEEDEVTLSCRSGLSLSALCEQALKRGLSGLEFAYGIPGTVGGAVYMNAGAYGGEMKDVLLSARHLAFSGGKPEAGVFTGEEMGLSYRHSAYSDSDMIITGATVRLKRGDPAEIRAKMDDYMNRRRSKQPLELPSAGSTFRRPPGNYASALIDQCGLKGRRVGGAMVSEKHAGFVVNTGEATAADVLELIQLVRDEVREKTGYQLECEIKIIA